MFRLRYKNCNGAAMGAFEIIFFFRTFTMKNRYISHIIRVFKEILS